MTDFCQHVPMSRLFETQNSGVSSPPHCTGMRLRPFGRDPIPYGTRLRPFGRDPIPYGTGLRPFGRDPILYGTGLRPFGRDPIPVCAGLLRFSLFEAVKNQSFIKLEPKLYLMRQPNS